MRTTRLYWVNIKTTQKCIYEHWPWPRLPTSGWETFDISSTDPQKIQYTAFHNRVDSIPRVCASKIHSNIEVMLKFTFSLHKLLTTQWICQRLLTGICATIWLPDRICTPWTSPGIHGYWNLITLHFWYLQSWHSLGRICRRRLWKKCLWL